MNITFKALGKSQTCNLNVRLYHGREIDCNAPSMIFIDKSKWSDKMQRFKNDVQLDYKDKYQNKLNELKSFIQDSFNDEYSKGETINSQWLKKIIMLYHKRPTGDTDNWELYFIPYITEVFLKEFSKKVNKVTGKQVSHRTVQKYQTLVALLNEFESSEDARRCGIKDRIKHRDITLKFHESFDAYMSQVRKYGGTTRGKNFKLIKALCRKIENDGLPIPSDYKSSDFYVPKEATVRRQNVWNKS